MFRVETIQQFYIKDWLEKHFDLSAFTIKLIDHYNVKIINEDNKEAIVTYHEKDITLKAL